MGFSCKKEIPRVKMTIANHEHLLYYSWPWMVIDRYPLLHTLITKIIPKYKPNPNISFFLTLYASRAPGNTVHTSPLPQLWLQAPLQIRSSDLSYTSSTRHNARTPTCPHLKHTPRHKNSCMSTPQAQSTTQELLHVHTVATLVSSGLCSSL